MTQLFISWSGDLAHKVAEKIHSWLPAVLQAADPFFSTNDIEKGVRWPDELARKLKESGFGIVVLTPDNLLAPWLLFEAGALSKLIEETRVSCFLVNLESVDPRHPLSQLQNTKFTKDDVLKLILSINSYSSNPVREDTIGRTFDALWPEFERDVGSLISTHNDNPEVHAQPSELDKLRATVGDLIQVVQSVREDTRSSQLFIVKALYEQSIALDVARRGGGVLSGIGTNPFSPIGKNAAAHMADSSAVLNALLSAGTAPSTTAATPSAPASDTVQELISQALKKIGAQESKEREGE